MTSQNSLKQKLDISRANLRLSKSEIYSLRQSMKHALQQMRELYQSEEFRQCRENDKKFIEKFKKEFPNSFLYKYDY